MMKSNTQGQEKRARILEWVEEAERGKAALWNRDRDDNKRGLGRRLVAITNAVHCLLGGNLGKIKIHRKTFPFCKTVINRMKLLINPWCTCRLYSTLLQGLPRIKRVVILIFSLERWENWELRRNCFWRFHSQYQPELNPWNPAFFLPFIPSCLPVFWCPSCVLFPLRCIMFNHSVNNVEKFCHFPLDVIIRKNILTALVLTEYTHTLACNVGKALSLFSEHYMLCAAVHQQYITLVVNFTLHSNSQA